MVPPTVGVLYAMSKSFDQNKPWSAVAGERRGVVDIFTALEFTRISDEAKNAAYGVGTGNSVNIIMPVPSGRFCIYGERTLQRTESKLTALHNMILVNYVVNGLAQIGRRFVFEPNDTELLMQLNLAMEKFLQAVTADRGIEDHNLVVDQTNNNADTRNQREVIVDLEIVPTDVMERLFINATVRESGATLNGVTSAPQ